uniref:Cytochrome P450 n=1 Tax=Candidatus Kentrum sp. UNK TaxID=2126344 RepID=A0A451AJN5_9GAMM|nr:MAG: Cytochrome P450 [Candidatus Kentron sp. UNK]VFK71845.1 MAG: Cytochrome P450 [Candidatus Kentron sp. UNK]
MTQESRPFPEEQEYPGNAEWIEHDNPHILFAELAKEQGPVVPLLGKRKLVAINGLETITEVLKDQADKVKRPTSLESVQSGPVIRTLPIKDGPLHKEQRVIMAKVINDFIMTKIPETEACIRQATDFIIEEIATGQPVDPDLPVGAGMMFYVYQANFGVSLTREEAFEAARKLNTLSFMKNALSGRFQTFREELAPSVGHEEFIRKFELFKRDRNPLYEVGVKQVAEHQRSFDPNRLRDMTDGLIKANQDYKRGPAGDNQLNEEDILAGSLFQLFGASKATTTMFVIYALHYMATNPEIQAAIQDELDRAMAEGAQPGYFHRDKTPLTHACMWEILRHSSLTAIATFNYETKEEIVAAGQKLDKGAILFINYYSTTRDKRYWPDPEAFDPKRFLNKDGKIDRDQLDKFLPFGIGSHKCLGGNWAQLSVLTFFATLVARCRFEKAPSTPDRLGQHAGVFLIPHNYELIATRRESIMAD